MLKVSGLNQFYGESHTLWDIDLTIPKGSCMCLMGHNGVGKTTLLNSIMGILPTASGDIEFDGETFCRRLPEMRAKNGIGYVPQGRDIFSQLTVEENLRIGLLARRDAMKEIPQYIFELFPVLKEMLKRANP